MRLGNVFNDCQTQAGATKFAASGLIDPVKALKQPGKMLFGDADALIPDTD